MMGAAPIIALLLSLPPCYAERADPLRVEHVQLQAEAIAAASDSPADAAALSTIAVHEGNLCWSVATGKQHGGDGWGPWQLEPGSHRSKPYYGDSLPPLTHAAGEALWLWHHSHQCGSWPAARFRGYAGVACDSKWGGAARRAAFYGWALQKLRSLGAQ